MTSAIQNNIHKSPTPQPIIYTIAGSDSGGGAGIQADLHTIHDMGGFGCTAVTALTAQNSVGVTAIHSPPPSFLRAQLDCLQSDLPFDSLKIGMLGNQETINCVADWLDSVLLPGKLGRTVVLDPVMISTSGSRLITEDAQEALVSRLFKHADIVTPNIHEASALVGYQVDRSNAERAARDILDMGCKAVLIKGGHMEEGPRTSNGEGRNDTVGVAMDLYLEGGDVGSGRLCDSVGGVRGVWIKGPRYDSVNTHGTGCTLSSAIATSLGWSRVALGGKSLDGCGVDAVVEGKGYVGRGIEGGRRRGEGPGPVGHEGRMGRRHCPWIGGGGEEEGEFERVDELDKVIYVVGDMEDLRNVVEGGGREVQLRYKGDGDVGSVVRSATEYCRARGGVRLWVNDHWEAAVEHGAYGVHLGQEDLRGFVEGGGAERVRGRGVKLGISTHSVAELAVAKGLRPSYVSLGPVYETSSKEVAFGARGLEQVERWRELVDEGTPLVAIGGINTMERGREVRRRGAEAVAVLGIVKGKGKDEVKSIIEDWRGL
ncbi:hypothetical protein TrCOL_g2886 [Triparma columacea]|uniref:Thiamine-phosphate pyrophosphorylase n=1 Tax=Triparma columacea TaxID=722753 RepID=A0A9W7GD37_9STRA|nr:hypothetical protein TrCOL_g2886 [Triparma columacea]